MSIGPTSGIVGSAAGAPLAQNKGSEVERSSQDSSAQQRQVDAERAASDAAGVGDTAEDQQASERDADGRRLWEAGPDEEQSDETEDAGSRKSKDPTGDAGTQLDLSG